MKIFNIFCTHKNRKIIKWYYTHGKLKKDPIIIKIQYKCIDCDKIFYKYKYDNIEKYVQKNLLYADPIGRFDKYRGFVGSIEYTDQKYHGRILNLYTFVDYSAESLEQLEIEFHKAADNYLEKVKGYAKFKE